MITRKERHPEIVMSERGRRISEPVKDALWFTGDIQKPNNKPPFMIKKLGRTAAPRKSANR